MACKLCGAYLRRRCTSLMQECPGYPNTRGLQQQLNRLQRMMHLLTGKHKHLKLEKHDSLTVENAKLQAQEATAAKEQVLESWRL
eukprot:3462690-Amphidinium_carterae.2